MGYASVGTFVILVLMELVKYPFSDKTPKLGDKEVFDEDDIRGSELLEMYVVDTSVSRDR